MRFLCVNRPTKANIFGQEYRLKPLDPQAENLDDILVTDDFSASELFSRHKELLLEVKFNANNLMGYPQIVNSLSDLKSGGKILILRNGGIGDHIQLLPALAVYRKLFPKGTQIWLATQKEKHPIFLGNNNIDKLYPLPLRLDVLLQADCLIDFSGRHGWYDSSRSNLTDSLLNFLEIDYEKIEDKSPRMQWSRDRSTKICNLFENVKKRNTQKSMVLLNWKASNRLRDLPPEKILFLAETFENSLFVVAQPREFSESTTVPVKEYGHNVFDVTSHMVTLENYIAAIANCDAVVTTDTGTGHIAEALGKPSIVIYGPTKDDLWIRYYQKTYPIRAEYSGITCQSPCGLIKGDIGCRESIVKGTPHSPCLLSISNERISQAFTELMERECFI